ncbi:ABC transporter ATP-binding protein [Bradyrhizobium sp. AZCC 2230]|uniref:ABC transporter ATP-binding protein n=1 Tax=Bradyrhizobium sp. AZCC 2230 TaxID=3117021 RepID=UPI002FF19123
MADPVLKVEELSVCAGRTPILDRVSFEIGAGEVVSLVGESGSGKSMIALSIMRLLAPPVRIMGGSVRFNGRDLVALNEKALRRIRGREVAMVFQEPMSSLNPVLTIGDQIMEVLVRQGGLSRTAAHRRAVELLERVQISAATRRMADYPAHLSGGMRQRVMIAIALACDPALLIADEPTTALDVTVQAQILDLLRDLNKQSGTAVLMITHDLGVVAEFSHRVVVLYAGRVAERAGVEALFAAPRHPYTRGLLAAMPALDGPPRLPVPIPGSVPPLDAMPIGCRFSPRCHLADSRCAVEQPPLELRAPGQESACWRSPL